MSEPGNGGRGDGGRGDGGRRRPVFVPRADIFETPEAIVLELEMPGANADTITVQLDNRALSVSGTVAHAPPGDFRLAQAEYRDGDYERAFTLSEAVDAEGIEAVMKDGLLTLKLPKASPAKARAVKVKTG